MFLISGPWPGKDQCRYVKGLASAFGIYGDLQGIAGKSLQEIEGLEMKALGLGEDF